MVEWFRKDKRGKKGWKGKDGWMEEKSRINMNGMKEKGKDGLKEKKRMHRKGRGGWNRNERCKE